MSLYASHTEVRSVMIVSLHEWWLAHRHGDIPDRADLDPVDFTRLLSNMLISEVVHQPFRIRYRLVGTKVVEATGLDITGLYLDELTPAEDEPWADDYRLAYQSRAPVFGTTYLVTAMGVRFPYEFGIFPLRNGGTSVDQFVAVEDYFGFSASVEEPIGWRSRSRPPSG